MTNGIWQGVTGIAVAAGLLASTPAAASTLLGESVKITDSYDAIYVAYGFYSGANSQVFNRTINAGCEVCGGGMGDLTTFNGGIDFDPVNHRILFGFTVTAYNVRIEPVNWKIRFDLSPFGSERFTSATPIYNTSSYAGVGATFTDYSLTVDLSGGYLNTLRNGTTFGARVDFGTEPNPNANAVPEPAIWGTMLGGLFLVGAALRRRRPQTLRHA